MTGHDCCSPSRDEGIGPVTPVTNVIAKTKGMSLVTAQNFLMGSDSHHVFYADEEGPARLESVDDFWIDQTAVTNADFANFVSDTGYQTEAEVFGWSFVFDGLVSAETLENFGRGRLERPNWWLAINGADWAHPFGPDSKFVADHTVVHVSWNDAHAYANWAGKRLPTEVEWECAARGGLEQRIYPWGDEFYVNGKPGANIWQGEFPAANSLEDGYLATAPAISFAPNGYGLYNMVGNVWEWTASEFRGQKVLKGGSYLCHDSYCNRYRNSARIANTPDSSLSHTGFRLVVSKKDVK